MNEAQYLEKAGSVTWWLGYFQSFAFYNNDNMPSSLEIAKVGSKFCQILNKPY